MLAGTPATMYDNKRAIYLISSSTISGVKSSGKGNTISLLSVGL